MHLTIPLNRASGRVASSSSLGSDFQIDQLAGTGGSVSIASGDSRLKFHFEAVVGGCPSGSMTSVLG